MTAKFKPIKAKPPVFDLSPFEQAVENTIEHADELFGLTYVTWEHQPEFEQSLESDGNQIIGSTLTSGEGSRENPYPFITRGTDVRFAIMTPDFAAKTKPNVLGSTRGAGGLLIVGKKPMPGIEARRFEENVKEVEEPLFFNRATEAMAKFALNSGHSL